MKRHWAYVALAVLAAASAVLAWRWFAPRAEMQASGGPAKAPAGIFRPTPAQWAGFRVSAVETRTFQSTLSTEGTIAFNEDAVTPVFSPYSGRVARLMAKPGDFVRRGAPLMAVDASEFVQGQSDIATTKANLDTARITERRQHDLYEAGAAALKDWRQAQTDLAAAQAAYAAARGRLRILGRSEAEIEALEKGQATNAEAVLAAPITGTITQRQVGPGQYIASASGGATTPVFTIGDLSTVWLVANVRESDAPALRVGQSVDVSVLALPGMTFTAKISWVGAAIDAATHRLPVRAEVQNRDGLLKPMMFANFTVATSAKTAAPAVPPSAILYEGDQTRVFVVENDGIAVRSVEVGRRQGGMVEVVRGLRAGEKIVTAGTLFVDRAASGD